MSLIKWIWIAIDTANKQVIAFYFGDRSRKSAKQLWKRIPQAYRDHATFATDDWEAYKGVIPAGQHEVCAKGSGRTNIIERSIALCDSEFLAWCEMR